MQGKQKQKKPNYTAAEKRQTWGTVVQPETQTVVTHTLQNRQCDRGEPPLGLPSLLKE